MEAYKRARLIDGVTADDDKVAPVYKLDEICTLLEESTPDVVKEVSDYLLQRLDRGSPFVKQKVSHYGRTREIALHQGAIGQRH